jgi:N-methylhydantoinase B/oxoprolinase/acetone carboxylase alpha subunit
MSVSEIRGTCPHVADAHSSAEARLLEKADAGLRTIASIRSYERVRLDFSGTAGRRAAVDFVLPEGRVANARHPATVNLYFPTAHLVYNGAVRTGLEVLEVGVLTVRSSNHIFATHGHGSGLAPSPSRIILNPDRADRKELSAIETRHLKAGDVIRFERSGGGGFGPPSERSPEAVRDDVRNGYVSPRAAAEIYRQPQD